MKNLQVGDVLIQHTSQVLWAVIEVEPDLMLRDPYDLQPDIHMPPIVAASPDFDMLFKFAWHHKDREI